MKVLIAEESPALRQKLAEILNRGGIEVVGEAWQGRQVVELCEQLRPDLVLMAVDLEGMNGLEATEQIMAFSPTPILVLSDRPTHPNCQKVLAAGAVDCISSRDWENGLVRRVRLVSRVAVITHPRARLKRADLGPPPPGGLPRVRLICLGTSTGGPGALVEILSSLPPTLQVPILVVIHIQPPLGGGFAQWLASKVPRPVDYARSGQLWQECRGRVLLAPPDRHLRLAGPRLVLDDQPPRHSCRPSVDVLFESVAQEVGSAALACLLTGMGRDGAAGLLAIHRAGGLTMAQDEASSVVYGMPREAVQLGAAQKVVPLQQVSTLIQEACEVTS
ncbi:MAG: response regulator [Candidatus Eremiobacteraeota bacterium]|nr:response regulator [Candidatus Eremiobacteraeota bacterium]MCW5869766.1 response regulator [Candidatus Eremiobacteraeota bacterium]